MGNVYVISDLHFGHPNMAVHRGFSSAEEHDQYIIDKWNSVVTKGDTVWILGDISMEKKSPYANLEKLKGIKKVVMGNHDMPKPSHNIELFKYVNAVAGVVTDKKGRYILSHVPVHPSELYRFKVNIQGHTHDKYVRRRFLGINLWKDSRYINVSCEAVDYTPVLLKEII